MPYVKPISGHTSCTYVQDYLERGGRALTCDCINLLKRDEMGLSWSQQMDETRDIYDNDRSRNGKRTRTYNHYVLSPDPRDNLSLDDLRDYACEWAEQAFPDFQVAIVYHNDSKGRLSQGKDGILHAHLIVNNTNLDTGRRLAPYLTAKKVREISKLAQDMAKERGWHAFEQEERLEESADTFRGFALDGKDTKKKENSVHEWKTDQGSYYTREELSILEEKGWSWKEDLRARIRIAKALSTTELEFAYVLRVLSVKVSNTVSGDYLFTHPERETWRVSGMKLGRDFCRETIQNSFETDSPKSNFQNDAVFFALKSRFSMTDMHTIGWASTDGEITLRDVADMLEANLKFDIKGQDDYQAVLKRLDKNSEDYAELASAQNTAKHMHLDTQIPKAKSRHRESDSASGCMPLSKMTHADAVRTIKELFKEEMRKCSESEDPDADVRDFDAELSESSARIRHSQQEQERYAHQSFRQIRGFGKRRER